MSQTPLRLGMVGGGPGAFIGAVHRTAAALDAQFQLVAGAFSSDAEKSAAMGRELGLDASRAYPDWKALMAGEAALLPEQRIQAVSVVTPNHQHLGPTIAALRAGFPVICDKPLTTSLALAEEIATAVQESGLPFCLTHNYSGYPLIAEAKELVASGAIGQVRKVFVEYLQGWLADPIEREGQKQAVWRTDPTKSGPGGSLGDIATHAFQLLEHVSGDTVARVFGKATTFVEGRSLDDDAMVLLEMAGGANGVLCSSQVCVGKENGLRLRIFGTEGGLEWQQEHPNDLWVHRKGKPSELRRAGNAYLSATSQAAGRIPAGHPEGYLEAFANLYSAFAQAVRGEQGPSFPGILEGLRGMQFVEAVLESSSADSWIPLALP